MAVRAADLLPAADQLAPFAFHPLRVQSLFYEILAGMWVRNGLQIKGQAMTYIQANFCNSMVDMDIYWLQICAAHLPPDLFIDMCIDTFGVREWLSMTPMSALQAAEQDAMVEGLLTFLAILVSSRTNLGNDEVSQSRLEVATLLACGDKTHSQLLELIPERSGNAHTRNFETVLKELSVYRAPPRGSESLEQGLFVPRAIVWEHYYEPLHVLRRAVHRRDFHASMDRFTAYVAEKRKAEGNNSNKSNNDGSGNSGVAGNSNLWPPLRPAQAPPGVEFSGDPRQICSSGVLQGALLGVLHRGVRRRDAGGGGVPDHVLALAVFLLAAAADLQPPPAPHSLARPAARARRVAGAPLLRAFPTGALCDNARTLVAHVAPAYAAHDLHPQPYHSDSEPEWEGAEGVESEAGTTDAGGNSNKPCIMSTSTALAIPPSMQMFRSGGVPIDDGERGEEGNDGGEGEMRALEEGTAADAAVDSTALVVPGAMPLAEDMSLALAAPRDRLHRLDHLELDASPTIDYDINPVEWGARALPAPPAESAPAHCSDENQVEVTRQRGEQVPVNESIISLLLKLHSALSGRLDSFALEEPAPDSDTHIGDGPHFIGRVLHKLAALDPRCADAIQLVRHSLWPHQREREAEQRARERREKEERSRRARERQAAVMREFARRQQQFLSAVRQLEGEQGERMECEGESEGEGEWETWRARDYDCVICNTRARASAHDPIGLVVLLQSSSVLGHRRRADGGAGALALSEPERSRLAAHRAATAAAHHYRLHDDLHQHFDQESWVLSVNVGWEGGVVAQSCGHHVHLRCLRAYLRSLAAPRPPNLLVERGEFLCPLCRQLANSVLPLAPPPPPAPAPAAPRDHLRLAADVSEMLEREPVRMAVTELSEAMGLAMTDMTNAASGKVKLQHGSSPAAIFTFMASLVRTNLECELVQRGNTLVVRAPPRYKPRDDCIVPLMSVASVHARALLVAGSALGVAHTWRALVPALEDAGEGAAGAGSVAAVPAGGSRPVPLLLRDPTALLLQVLLLAPDHPPHIDIQHFTCIVRTLYALTYYQVVNQLCARGALSPVLQQGGESEGGLADAARLLLTALGAAGDRLLDDDSGPRDTHEPFDIDKLELEVQELILPYLRISSLIRKHVYGGELPHVASARDEFRALLLYLQLYAGEGPRAHDALPPGAEHAAAAWARQLARAAAGGQLAVHRVISSLHVSWAGPALLRLPREYDRLFTYYHERVCLQCGAVPKEASVCLLCGTLVCLKQPCCRHHQVAEAVQHATECGGGTGIFLVVTSTYIIVIRGRRACLWGSLYLDDYDEEDRDLKRGKPLYLSEDRVELLQAQWLAHRFDHTKRTWVWHRDSL
ncbi:E3 ubiquitin-protein ligase Ubr3 isoform X2 [Leptidea sinapis]|nr:E3 ubiquitin-protein ligase Ubr3 isoform X2 [Leptidea sinapis]XP_050675666.1 E3 ubiquitin-protein ligase Ubr3 isoform X2 [Leptidea sinapis]XP_050675667.1 E3 ubiquitin-protein ligase Ubr3 isoform X2 [Leptidea sinapis]XP_050675668.1 E3 ubiquitin-protein ligase Ubr3 isoform X2 [Leptidea sinapis]XP_050675669.1 E3 ubiquitin-protein ligase Ubr3 isoform X2 [Leptidea sinapis]XP_050675670.1 E3 ubiquitin-protein ligase Ubr3 isoform X2 [Leptidea sinapis]XP_050675672.1 E3 ubiquitin-protein ligase Ubr3